MRKWLRDMGMDFAMVLFEVVVVIMKVFFIYLVIDLVTDLDHDIALETAILIGAVDFLNGQRTKFRTVSDVKEKISLTEKGKKITRTITSHRERNN